MKRGFKVLYFANLGIIVVALLSPIIEWASEPTEYPWLMKYYVVLIVVSVTFGVSFLGLNAYGIVKYKQHRNRYLWATILMSALVVFGVFQIVYIYNHNIVF